MTYNLAAKQAVSPALFDEMVAAMSEEQFACSDEDLARMQAKTEARVAAMSPEKQALYRALTDQKTELPPDVTFTEYQEALNRGQPSLFKAVPASPDVKRMLQTLLNIARKDIHETNVAP